MATAQLRSDLLTPAVVARGLEAGAAVIDVRTAEAFDAGHAPGAVNVPGGGDTSAVARHVVALDAPVIALATDADEARWAAADLRAGGFRRVLGAAAGPAIGPLLGNTAIGRSGSIGLDRLADELRPARCS